MISIHTENVFERLCKGTHLKDRGPVVSLTFLRCVDCRVSWPGSKHLPFVLPAQPGPQEQDRIQLSARHDVCRYGPQTLSTVCSEVLQVSEAQIEMTRLTWELVPLKQSGTEQTRAWSLKNISLDNVVFRVCV